MSTELIAAYKNKSQLMEMLDLSTMLCNIFYLQLVITMCYIISTLVKYNFVYNDQSKYLIQTTTTSSKQVLQNNKHVETIQKPTLKKINETKLYQCRKCYDTWKQHILVQKVFKLHKQKMIQIINELAQHNTTINKQLQRRDETNSNNNNSIILERKTSIHFDDHDNSPISPWS